jgi:hypothetical protein
MNPGGDFGLAGPAGRGTLETSTGDHCKAMLRFRSANALIRRKGAAV